MSEARTDEEEEEEEEGSAVSEKAVDNVKEIIRTVVGSCNVTST